MATHKHIVLFYAFIFFFLRHSIIYVKRYAKKKQQPKETNKWIIMISNAKKESCNAETLTKSASSKGCESVVAWFTFPSFKDSIVPIVAEKDHLSSKKTTMSTHHRKEAYINILLLYQSTVRRVQLATCILKNWKLQRGTKTWSKSFILFIPNTASF